MQVYMVIIVYEDRSVVIDSVFADFDAAEVRTNELRNEYRNLQNCRVNFVYTSQGYTVRQQTREVAPLQYTLHWMNPEGAEFTEDYSSLGDVYDRMNFLNVSRVLRVGYYVVNFQ